MTEQQSEGRADIVGDVSRQSGIRRDVVKDVLDAFVDVAVEKVVNYGSFRIKNLVSIYATSWRSYVSGSGHTIPPHNRLVARLSSNLRDLFKMKEIDSSTTIDRDNWRDIVLSGSAESVTWARPQGNSVDQDHDTD